MTDLQITLIAERNFGDHGDMMRHAHNVEPGETVEHLVERLMKFGEFGRPYMNPETPASWIEIRYVDGTLPEPPASDVAPF